MDLAVQPVGQMTRTGEVSGYALENLESGRGRRYWCKTQIAPVAFLRRNKSIGKRFRDRGVPVNGDMASRATSDGGSPTLHGALLQ